MASSSYDALAAEVDRITACPYPSQLRTLRDIAISQCSDADISNWAAAKPCLIDSLASCLLEGLQQWSYVLEIIAKFALNAICRDAFLRQEPTLLHSVVAQAVKTGDMRSKYAQASVTLLSMPLPDTVALPAEVQALFVQLVEEAAKKPSSTTIEPVYRLLTGTGKLLLGILNADVLARFEERLLDILKNGSGPNDQGLGLYCLSIMNVVCSSMDPEFRLTASTYNSSDFLASTPTSSRWKAEAMQQFFTGSKAKASLQLLAIMVIWATNRTGPESTGEKVRSLVLANEVVAAIPVDLRKNWCAANSVTIRKLQEKLCAENLNDTIKALGLRFMGKLCDLDSLPHPVLESIEMTFLEPRSVQTTHTLCPHVDDSELFANVLARAPISLLLQNAVDYAIRADSTELASGLEAVTRMVRDALAIIEEQKITGHEIRATLNEASFAQALQRLKDMIERAPEQDGPQQSSGWCKKALHRMRSSLAHQISDLLLRVCHSSSMSQGSMSLLLRLHACSARGDLQCSHERPSSRDHFELGDLADETIPDHIDWREALHTHFKARANVEHDAVTRLFAKACASLEARCETVERPLREEQEKRRSVEKNNKELTQAFAQVEAQNIDYSIRTRDLEEERDRFVQSLEDTRDENTELLERITNLERKLRGAHAQGEKQLAEFKNAKQISELDSASVIARKQEEYDDLQEEYQQATRENSMREQENATLQADLTRIRSERDHLQEVANTGDARLREANANIDELQQKYYDLEASSNRLQEQLSSANNNLASGSQEVCDLTRQLQGAQDERNGLQASLERETEALHSLQAKQEDAERLAQQQQASIETMERQFGDLQQELQEKQEQFSSDLEARNAKISDLKKKVDRLQRKCEQKDQQIAEAEAMRTNLMAAMGLSNTQKLPHRSRESVAQFTQQTQDDPTPPTPTSGEGMEVDPPQDQEEDQSFISNEGGPTPKRPRSRKSIVAPSTAVKSRSSKSLGGMLGGKGTQSAARRQTLGVVSGNRTQTKPVTFASPEKGWLDEGEETTFDGSELFTGTQGARMVDETYY